jgi:hypothetical protein
MISRNVYYAAGLIVIAGLGGVEITALYDVYAMKAVDEEVLDAVKLLRLSIACAAQIDQTAFTKVSENHRFSGDGKKLRLSTATTIFDVTETSKNMVTVDGPWKAVDRVSVVGNELRIYCATCLWKSEFQTGAVTIKYGRDFHAEPIGRYRLCDAQTAVNAATAMNIIGGVHLN